MFTTDAPLLQYTGLISVFVCVTIDYVSRYYQLETIIMRMFTTLRQYLGRGIHWQHPKHFTFTSSVSEKDDVSLAEHWKLQ